MAGSGTITHNDADSIITVNLELIDNIDPLVSITSPTDGEYLGGHNITVEWDITDISSYTWELYLGGASSPKTIGDHDDPYNFNFDPSDPNYFGSYHGVVAFRVEVFDSLGNDSSDSVILTYSPPVPFGYKRGFLLGITQFLNPYYAEIPCLKGLVFQLIEQLMEFELYLTP